MLDDLEEVKERKLKKFFIISIGAFILIIFLIYILVNSIGSDILAGLISSSEIREDELDFSFNGKLIFMNNSLERLKDIYFSDEGVEFKACLVGYKENDIYFMEDLYIPKIYSQRFNQVIAEPCPSDSLVSLHSHPFRHCLPSQQDFRSFKQFKERNEDALMIVMCEKNRFSVHE